MRANGPGGTELRGYHLQETRCCHAWQGCVAQPARCATARYDTRHAMLRCPWLMFIAHASEGRCSWHTRQKADVHGTRVRRPSLTFSLFWSVFSSVGLFPASTVYLAVGSRKACNAKHARDAKPSGAKRQQCFRPASTRDHITPHEHK